MGVFSIVGNVLGAIGIPNNTVVGKALGSTLTATEKNRRKEGKKMNSIDNALSGNLRLGTDRFTGYIPVIIAAAVAFAIAIGGGLIRFGKKRRR